MNCLTIRSAVEHFAKTLPPGAKVLDVGCGMQPYKQFFSHVNYIGLDVWVSGREAHEKTADIYFHGENIPMDSESVDSVLCTEVLEHSVNPDILIREMYRVLRPGGRLCITVPFIWGLHEQPYDFRRYTPFGLAKLIEKYGFLVDHQEKITVGARAVRMLIDSEVNNFLVNVVPGLEMSVLGRTSLKVKVWLHERLLRLIERTWHSTFIFERIFIDNLLIAHKE